MRFSYYPGCSLHATAREYGESIEALAEPLGFELNEIEDWCCCGATPAHAIDQEGARALGLWNLAHAAKAGSEPLLTGCAACFSRLRAAGLEAAEDPEPAREAFRRIGVDQPPPEVVHIAQVLSEPAMKERISSLVTRPLTGLKAACYYGCLLTRPRGAGIDDPEDPHLLEDLVRLTGAEPVDWPLRLDCCGASMAIPRVDLVRELAGKLLEMAHDRGAQCMIVACPLCHSNLDFQQDAALRQRGLTFRLPVLYLTQLIGLALGMRPDRLGLQRHFVPVPADLLAPAQEVKHV